VNSVPDQHVRTKSDQAFLDQGGVWDEAAGQKVIDFIERYLLLEDGRPLVLLPWMKGVIRSWYCWVTPEGKRRTRIGLLTCARKNAKSILTYALTAYHLIADGVTSPACASVAVNREQAAQIFDWLRFSIENNAKLSKALHVIPSKKTILYPAKNGRYRSLASDSKGGNFGHGFSFLVHDELAFQKDDLYTVLKNSTDARQGLQVITSTAGFNKNGIFFKLTQYARKVLDGTVIDTTFQPWVFEVPEGEEDIEASWVKGNPSLGVCQTLDDFRNQWHREKQDATTRHAFSVLKFNQFRDTENVWIPAENWDGCKGVLPHLNGRECVIGCDVGAVRDLTALVAIFPLEDGKFAVKSWGFVPNGALTTRDGANTTLYQSFSKTGHLTILPGTATDEYKIIAHLDELRQKYKVRAVVFDQWQSLPLSNHCKRQGLTTFNFRQTHSYFHGPVVELEKLVNRKKLVHDGDPLLRWQVGHTYLDTDPKGYKKPITSRPENKKDNLIALLMALSQTLQQTGTSKPSVYEERKLFAV